MSTETWNEYYQRKLREIEALPDDPKPELVMSWEEYYASRMEMIERGELVFEGTKAHTPAEKDTNTPEPKEEPEARSIETLSPSRRKIAKKLIELLSHGDWLNKVTTQDMQGMMRNILGVGEPLDKDDLALSNNLWALIESGRGGDRVKIVFQNMIGYFIAKDLLSHGSKSQNKKFFNDESSSYTNIDKGRRDNDRPKGFKEIVPLLDKFCPEPKGH